jgi:carbon-monoxide dehydrogenase medium subunit
MTPNLEQDELLTEIKISPWQESHGYAFVEFSRRHGDFAIAGVGCLIALDTNQNVKRIAITIIGVSSTPVRLFEAEKAVIGNRLQEDLMAHFDHEISLLEASNDAQTTAVYRKKIASTLLRRAINQATHRAQQGLN